MIVLVVDDSLDQVVMLVQLMFVFVYSTLILTPNFWPPQWPKNNVHCICIHKQSLIIIIIHTIDIINIIHISFFIKTFNFFNVLSFICCCCCCFLHIFFYHLPHSFIATPTVTVAVSVSHSFDTQLRMWQYIFTFVFIFI